MTTASSAYEHEWSSSVAVTVVHVDSVSVQILFRYSVITTLQHGVQRSLLL
jgi:hypothetical protein